MKNVNGTPVVPFKQFTKPVLERYGRLPGDIKVRDDIVADLRKVISVNDLEVLRRFLSEDKTYWLGNLQWTWFQRFHDFDPLANYEDWAESKCNLLLAVARQTREDDYIIQYLVNYEDFIVEVFPFSCGASFIVQLYELRGLDFFLFHPMGGQTIAHDDKALFDNAALIPKALSKSGRFTEAESVAKALESRKQRLTEIEQDLHEPDYDPATDIFARIRIVGEKFWSDYLTPMVWTKLDIQSTRELVDAFSTEYLLRREVLSTWSSVALILCKVVEREIAHSIFSPWKPYFTSANWNPPEATSKKIKKSLESRFMTFKTLQSCSSEKGHPPSLGQLLFLAKYWEDPIMDQCTNVFRDIRNHAAINMAGYSAKIANLVQLLEQPVILGNPVITIPDARNRSAHPREDEGISWDTFIEGLKELLGQPPSELLKLVVNLSVEANAAQQNAPADSANATPLS